MPRSVRDEVDALMMAALEQIPEWHEAVFTPTEGGGDEMLSVGTSLHLALSWNRVLKDAILRLAEEIDRLDAAMEQNP